MTGLLPWLEWAGVAVFALTGALVAARKQMDPFGFALLGTVTGIGGGTLRDILLGARPVPWIGDPTVVAICVAVSLAAFFTAHHFESEGRARTLLWADALGLARNRAKGGLHASRKDDRFPGPGGHIGATNDQACLL